MSGNQTAPTPTDITLHGKSRVLELTYADGKSYRLSFELLRVESPSAEVKGHGPGQETLQLGKHDVTIDELEPVGNYGIKPTFSDGHSTGIYSWVYLHHLCLNQQTIWQNYLDKVAAAGGAPSMARPLPNAQAVAAAFEAKAVVRPKN
jgi:DUF971 family protein